MDDRWRTLIVEDDRAVAAAHHRLLSATPGYRVVGIAESAERAVRMTRNLNPHLLLLDLSLPRTDGLTFLRLLRTRSIEIEVIAVTASRAPATVHAAEHLGVLDYLVKPFAVSRLRRSLELFEQRTRLADRRQLDQSEIDALHAAARTSLPRDITATRLEDVRAVLREAGDALSADAVAERLAVSRVTARRYLEHLGEVQQVWIDQVNVGPGRPRKTYRLLT